MFGPTFGALAIIDLYVFYCITEHSVQRPRCEDIKRQYGQEIPSDEPHQETEPAAGEPDIRLGAPPRVIDFDMAACISH